MKASQADYRTREADCNPNAKSNTGSFSDRYTRLAGRLPSLALNITDTVLVYAGNKGPHHNKPRSGSVCLTATLHKPS